MCVHLRFVVKILLKLSLNNIKLLEFWKFQSKAAVSVKVVLHILYSGNHFYSNCSGQR